MNEGCSESAMTRLRLPNVADGMHTCAHVLSVLGNETIEKHTDGVGAQDWWGGEGSESPQAARDGVELTQQKAESP